MVLPPLPPEDRRLSPHTGWTRSHWEAVADHLIRAAARYAGPEQALVTFPGSRSSVSGPRSDGLEGFARTFLLAAFRVAGAAGADPDRVLERYASGLVAGTATPTTDRGLGSADPVSWPVIGDHSQALVEAASIAVGLRLTRPWLWDRLDEPARQPIVAWLERGLRARPFDNNWWLFPAMVGAFLSEVGADPDRAGRRAVDRGLARIERWYLGDGWYTDGRPRSMDHYNGWALHLYPTLHAWLSRDQRLLDTYGNRLSHFVTDHARTFGGDGAPLHQGRSLCYRFAAAAPLCMSALTGHSPIPAGQTRRLASGALRYFVDRGAAEPDGVLSLGWHRAFPPMVQAYSGPASPYWASKAFVGLLLPADHPVWTAPEEAAPSERGDAVTPLRAPGWLIQSTAADGLVRAHNHGSDNQQADHVADDDPLYARLAYSTSTGPVFGPDPDNHFGLVVGGFPTARGRIRPLGVGDGWAASSHQPLAEGEPVGAAVTSVVLARSADEVHLHLVSGAEANTEVRHSGWAVAGSDVTTRSGESWSRCTADTLDSDLRALIGFDTATCRTADGTAFGANAAYPALSGQTGAGPTLFVCHATLVRGCSPRDVRAALDDDRVVIDFPEIRFEVRLTASSVHVTSSVKETHP